MITQQRKTEPCCFFLGWRQCASSRITQVSVQFDLQKLTRETTLLVMTPPNRVLTVFFWKKIQNTHCCFLSWVHRDACHSGSCRGRYYQLLGHLLDLGDEVREELGHVLLLAGVQRLLVHRVGLAEGPRVVGLPLALLHARKHNARKHNASEPSSSSKDLMNV